MKNKTMKKALALLLASLMILLAMPFSLLTVGAEETTELEITKFSAFGRHSDEAQTKLFFNTSFGAERAFDGDIGTENGDKRPYEMCYIDADGKMRNGTNASGTSYCGIFIVELSSFADVDTLSLWGIDSYGFGWMSNDGYDIYYSADGETYTAVAGASFENFLEKQDTADALYVPGTYNGTDGYVHDIAMGDVAAKYIAIAVSDYVPASDNADYKEMIFYEIVVTGTSVSVEEDPYLGIRSLKAFGRHVKVEGEGESAVTSYPNVAFYGGYPADNAFDGDIAKDAQTLNNDSFGNLPYEMCYFDENGVMVNGVNPVAEGKSYYLMFIIKLEDHATVDTLSLWTPYVNDSDPANRPYMANNGYDIYYSVDGESYTAVDGASFTDVYAKQSTADALYVAGTYNSKDGHVHDIAMGGVEARYIAIAVSDIVSGADEAIVSEAVVTGEPLEHEFVLIETVAPTCVDEGYDICACACGEEKKDNKTPATGIHTPGEEWTVIQDATCTATGTKEGTCTVCDGKVTDTIPTVEHNYGAWVDTQAPTCTATGLKTRTCVDCGYTATEEIPVIDHAYGEGVVTDPTCTEDGYKTKTCTVCGYTEKEAGATATGHNYGAWETTKAATCTEAGVKEKKCACGDTITEAIPVIAHTYGEWTETKAPTCTEAGSKEQKCACGDTKTEGIPALGHASAEKETIQEPTCTEPGEEAIGVCSRCGVSAGTQPIPALGHDYNEEITKDATCTEAGSKTSTCTRCGDTVTEAIDATGHSYGEWVVTAPTCTEAGYKTQTCANCGNVVTEAGAAATGHNYGAWETTKAATCTEEGSKKQTCVNCGDEKTEAIAKIAHTYGEWVVTNPTCTEAGFKTKTCSACGDVVTEAGAAATGHNHGAWEVAKAATCTEAGVKEKKCACGDTITEAIPATGHKHGEWEVTKAATCTEAGSKEKKCACGDTITEAIDATGHTWGDWVVTKEATYTEEGVKTRTCANCNGTATTFIPKLTDTIGIKSLKVFGYHVDTETGLTSKVGFYGTYPADDAFDGDITTDAQIMNHNRDGNTIKPYEMCYFNADGLMVTGKNHVETGKSYYLMFIIKLDGVTTVDTLSLWTPYAESENVADRPYMANNGYDIYYSVDGESYTAVEGASFENVYTDSIYNKDYVGLGNGYYVDGTYNEKDGHVHNINMGGVTAGYIVIAVSDIVYGADEAIISEVVVSGTPVPDSGDNESGEGSENGDGNEGGENTGNENTGNENTDNSGDSGNTVKPRDPESLVPPTKVGETDAAETEAESDAEGGCGSSVAMMGVALVGACAAMLTAKRGKKKEN